VAETPGPPFDRRRTPRVDLLAELQGHAVTLDEQVQVTQLSLGGMTVETTAPLSPRVQHDFRISLAGATLTVHGRVVHSRVVIRGDAVSYVAGLEFVEPTPAARDGIRRIIEASQAPSA
jgi:c-di-GMP-binding flagellar brake protein YcgR